MAEMGSKMAKNNEEYYILVKDAIGEKKAKGLARHASAGSEKKFVSLVKGDILVKLKKQPKERTLPKLSFSPFEKPSVVLQCTEREVGELDYEETNLLLPMVSMSERLKVFENREKLATGKEVVIGSRVWVSVSATNAEPREFKGVVKYKGPLPGTNGTMFGVELMECRGQGSTDGEFRGKYYFYCEKDNGMYVSLDILSFEPHEKSSQKQSFLGKAANLVSKVHNSLTEDDSSKNSGSDVTKLENEHGHKEGDIVWVYIDDKLERGVIKFIGDLQHATETMAGIRMDKRCGKGSGEYYGKYPFHCKLGHAHFTAIEHVISEEQYKEIITPCNTGKDGRKQNNEYETMRRTSGFSDEKSHCKHNEGDIVWVYIDDKLERGIIKFIGDLPHATETMAGIKMDKRCGQVDHAHFTSIEHVISEERYKDIITQCNTGKDRGRQNNEYETILKPTSGFSEKSNCNHNVGDKVWVYINEKPCRGHIRYFGQIPGHKVLMAGIELDQPRGKGDGEYNSERFFICDKNYAYFTPICNAISEERFSEMYESPDNYKKPDLKESTPSTSNDIVEMESKFAKQPREDLIKEQEEMLRRANEAHSSSGKHSQENAKDERNLCNDNVDTTNQPSLMREHKLDIGSMVEVLSKRTDPRYGVIRWIGFVDGFNKKVAGLELENEMDACTDGTFQGRRYFTCPYKRGLFVHLYNCRRDSRFGRSHSGQALCERRLNEVDFGGFRSPIIQGYFVPPPGNVDIYLHPGVPRGIQGHHNSCYLDATVLASFAFSSVIDTVLLRKRKEGDIEEYEEVQTLLRDGIVYPLRENGFVRADRVLGLRKLLDQLGTVAGLVGEEKDPEEFLLTLFREVLKSEPFLKIKSEQNTSEEYFYQVLADKYDDIVLPSVEELLKRSFHESNLKLVEVPSCLIMQMPQFGKQFKMYNRILPSLTINVGELVENVPQECMSCGGLAKFHCMDCFTITGVPENDSSGNFCTECKATYHEHPKRALHEASRPLVVSKEICRYYADHPRQPIAHQEMELFAVVCRETSHYVSFVKCKEDWCFFDSMADRVGSKDGHNLPAVTKCPEVMEWLSSEKQNRERIINADDKELPEKVRRILGDAYMCFYQSNDTAMYRINLKRETLKNRPEQEEMLRRANEAHSSSGKHSQENAKDERNLCNDNVDTTNQPSLMREHELDIGSMVEVLSKSSDLRYGVIRWLGFVGGVDKKVAGLELENEMDACTDGTFQGRRYFTCPYKRGLFVHLYNCRRDSRFGRSHSGQALCERRLNEVDFGGFRSPIIQGYFVPPPGNVDIYLHPGVPRGIQGHHNSCYLDATVLASFAFSSVIDTVLLRKRKEGDIEEYEEVQTLLRDGIVYPLRENGFVRADRVLGLRKLLDQLGTVAGLVGEEKDPEEFLLTLFREVLKSEPFLKIKSEQNTSEEYFYHVLADKDDERVLPSVEELLKRSFHESNLKLVEVPSCLIMPMSRFGKQFKMYNRILPSLTINVGELVENVPQECMLCGRLAKFHCMNCFTITGVPENDSSGNFCTVCKDAYHSHNKRASHEASRPLVVSKEICRYYADHPEQPIAHQEMELFAVVCRETSHYVSFVKCKEDWCFFDSMADRVGSKDGYNLPAVTKCPEVMEWLSSEKQNRERIINTDDKELPEKVRRILGDAYMCFYQSNDMAMYR